MALNDGFLVGQSGQDLLNLEWGQFHYFPQPLKRVFIVSFEYLIAILLLGQLVSNICLHDRAQ